MESCLFSGTGQITTPLRGSFIVGSQGNASLINLRLLRLKTTTSLFGVLKYNEKKKLKKNTHDKLGIIF